MGYYLSSQEPNKTKQATKFDMIWRTMDFFTLYILLSVPTILLLFTDRGIPAHFLTHARILQTP